MPSRRFGRHEGDFAAEGIAARVRLARGGIGEEAFAALDRGDRAAALEALLAELEGLAVDGEASTGATEADPREDLRRAIVGILTELEPAEARPYRRRLSAALS